MLMECPHCGAGFGSGHISYCSTLRAKPAPPKPPKMRCVREDEPPRDVSGGVALFFFGLIIGAGLGAWWMM